MKRVLAALAAAVLCLYGASLAEAQAPTMYLESMGQPFQDNCGTGSNPIACGIWNTPLAANAAIDPESTNLVALMDEWFPGQTGNRANFSISGGVSWWIATRTTPYVTVTLTNQNHPGLQAVLNQVPIPAAAHPSLGTDERMAVLQPNTGCTWEFWHLVDNAGAWSAATGGRTCHVFGAYGVYQNVQDAAGNQLEANTWGGPATGFPEMAGAAMVDEFAHGTIPHAVAFAIDQSANCAHIWTVPAQRTDGGTTAQVDANDEPMNCIPEGARFRLPPPCAPGVQSTLGVCFNVSDLAGDPPIVTELAQAAQTYGLIDENSTSGGLVAVESGDSTTNVYTALGADPYTTAITGEANTPFLGAYSNQNALALFPWNWLELVQMTVTSTPDPTWYSQSRPAKPALADELKGVRDGGHNQPV